MFARSIRLQEGISRLMCGLSAADISSLGYLETQSLSNPQKASVHGKIEMGLWIHIGVEQEMPQILVANVRSMLHVQKLPMHSRFVIAILLELTLSTTESWPIKQHCQWSHWNMEAPSHNSAVSNISWAHLYVVGKLGCHGILFHHHRFMGS